MSQKSKCQVGRDGDFSVAVLSFWGICQNGLALDKNEVPLDLHRGLIHIRKTIARDCFTTELSIVFTILCSVAYEPKTLGMSRSLAIEQAIIEALNGVNMMGIGTLYFDRQQHPDCGSTPIGDRGTNVGRNLVMGVTWKAE